MNIIMKVLFKKKGENLKIWVHRIYGTAYEIYSFAKDNVNSYCRKKNIIVSFFLLDKMDKGYESLYINTREKML